MNLFRHNICSSGQQRLDGFGGSTVKKMKSVKKVYRKILSEKSIGPTNSSGRHNMIHGHNMIQWVKTTDLCFKTDYKSVIFSDGSCMSVDHIMSTTGIVAVGLGLHTHPPPRIGSTVGLVAVASVTG